MLRIENINLGENEELDEEWYELEESENMPCDNTGICSGYNCPNYIKCKGE